MNATNKAIELAGALLDRVHSGTASLPGAIEKWADLIQSLLDCESEKLHDEVEQLRRWQRNCHEAQSELIKAMAERDSLRLQKDALILAMREAMMRPENWREAINTALNDLDPAQKRDRVPIERVMEEVAVRRTVHCNGIACGKMCTCACHACQAIRNF